MDERKGLQGYMRRPVTAKTADEAIAMIRTWKLARTRAIGMGLPDVGDLEMRDGLVSIVKDVGASHIDLQFRIRTLMSTSDAKRPTSRFMEKLERTLLEELKSIAADENVLTSEQGLYGNSVQVNPQSTGDANGKVSKDVATPTK